MGKNQLSHEEITKRFVEAKVFDFQAAGRLIAELGPALAVGDSGWHGVNFGRFNMLACMMPAGDVTRLVGNLRVAGITASALEGSLDASTPK